ncbi:hypothetical protein [Shinella sp.]|uniref:hypothetical protein n=1 Tax=Shinella sp. TaxID=1870904 RepID=UPI002897C0A0|nr:hypothetical protein [Shinella sp.]
MTRPNITIDGEERPMTDEEFAAWQNEPEIAPAVTVLYPVDLWSRLSNGEADAVEAAMATQPVRIQNIFRAASSYRSDHELWSLLETVATSLFGPSRAGEILASS